MIFNLIWGLILAGIIWNITKSSSDVEAYKKRYNSPTATRIKYDKRQVKRYAIGVAIAGGFLGVSLALMCTGNYWVDNDFGIVLMLITLWGLILGGVLLVIFGYQVIAGLAYFKRLERYGYEVPEDKRAYECMLEQMPGTRGGLQRQKLQGADVPEAHKTSKALACLSGLAGLAMAGCSFHYLYTWYFMGDDTKVMCVLLLIVDALWIVPVLLFSRQMNTQKFKDDVESDASRKNRMNICSGIATIVVLVGACLLVKYMAHGMSEYVFKTRMNKDQELIGYIHDALEVFYIDPHVIANDENFEEIICSLEKGVDITDWGTPEGEFQENVAMILEITDYSQLKDAFYSTDGPAVVYVKLEGETFTVQLLNLYPEVDREIVAK